MVTCGGKVEVGGEVVDVDVLGCGAGERNACNDRAQQETTLYLVTTSQLLSLKNLLLQREETSLNQVLIKM